MTKISTRITDISAVKLALLAKQMRSNIEGIEILNAEPIAVIGAGCRFPGGANSPEKYWQLLKDGVDAISEVPSDRWNVEALYNPNPATPGKVTTRWGGFLDRVDQFDPHFFGISPREAQRIDPQQRLFLEVAYEALENAGLTYTHLAGSQTGVFVASYHNDYGLLQYTQPTNIDAYTSTGTSHSIIPNRLSYLLNLQGPSISVDTACSSSLVAVHLACQSLRNEECDIALAGGVNLVLSPEATISLSKWGFMAPDGRCKTFDSRANGFVRGEGCGVITLKRLSDALVSGDNILALIRGSAVNQDGRTNVLTAPNGLAQQRVVNQALKNAGVRPSQISYIEAHGTGTVLGDPIEVEALSEIMGPRQNDHSCVLSSVKTNIGHLEAAAGIAGLIKVILSMQHQAIPPHLHFEQLNPHISLKNTPFIIPTELFSWNCGNTPRFAGVSSFGFGGTNAHVVLEEAPHLPVSEYESAPDTPFLLPLSAQNQNALQDLAKKYTHFLTKQTEDTASPKLADICYAAGIHRNHYERRLAVVGQSHKEIANRLEAFLQGTKSYGVASSHKIEGSRPKLVFVFSGQGPQWWAMGRELLAHEPTFKATIETCDSLFSNIAEANWSLLAELTAQQEQSRLDHTAIAQPAIFALQVALASLWQSWGVTPDAVVGHSVGEVAAAYVAGVLSLKDAIYLVFHRGRFMQQATGLGKMAAVELSPDAANQLIAPYGHQLSVAAINSPTSTVISGEEAALKAALETLNQQGIFNKMLPVDYAFHSHQMIPFQHKLTSALTNLKPNQAAIPLYSTVSGKLQNGQDCDAHYWGRNIKEPVRFATAINALTEENFNVFLEISPHPVLAKMIDQCLTEIDHPGVILASLRRKQQERTTMLTALGTLYTEGYPVDWKKLYPTGHPVVSLPLYPWQHKRYWVNAPARQRPTLDATHPLLGQQLRSPLFKDTVFETHLEASAPSFLADHSVFKNVILPATAYLEMALAAAESTRKTEPYGVENISIQAPLILFNGKSQPVQTIVTKVDAHNSRFQIFSLEEADETWQLHATGNIRTDTELLAPPSSPTLKEIKACCREEVAVSAHYQEFYQRGIDFGPTFQGVTQLWRHKKNKEALAAIQIPELIETNSNTYHFHPALLDACLQPVATTLFRDTNSTDVFLPVSLNQLKLYRRPTSRLLSYAKLHPVTEANREVFVGDFIIFDENGQILAEISGLHLKRTNLQTFGQTLQKSTRHVLNNHLYQISWQPQPHHTENSHQPQSSGNWLIFTDQGETGLNLASLLTEQGENCVVVSPGDTYLPPAVENIPHRSPQNYQIDPANIEHMESLLRDGLLDGQFWRGIVYLWGVDNSITEHTNEHSIKDMQRFNCGGLLHLVQLLAKKGVKLPYGLWLVTQGVHPIDKSETVALAQSTLWGFGQTIALEHPDLQCAQIDLDPETQEQNGQTLFKAVWLPNGEDKLAFRGETRFAARLVHTNLIKNDGASLIDKPVQLKISTRGILENLDFQAVTRRPPNPYEVEIRVRATGLNFRDVLNALGMYPGNPGALGDECAGEVTAVGKEVTNVKVGDRVMGLASGSFGTFVTTRSDLIVTIPNHLSFEEATTIPITFLTAYYALHHLAKISSGKRVLIHAAAGGVGMAAVQIAQQADAQIFGTAGNPEKRAFLKSIGVDYVMDSRSLDFADKILDYTNNQGVDIVLNSLTGDFIPKSLQVLKDNGHFLEIGKIGIWSESQFTQEKAEALYHVIFLGELIEQRPAFIQSMLTDIAHGMRNGAFAPLPHRAFPLQGARHAFRYMAHARHIGKVVVTQLAAPKIYPKATYLITGGWGGLGLLAAQELIKQEAKNLVLVGRSKPSTAAQSILNQLKQTGAQIIVAQGDISHQADIARILSKIEQPVSKSGYGLPPLKGIIHTAGVVADGVLLQQKWRNFDEVMAPKLSGTWNLHTLTQNMPLDFFVLFSSASSVLGFAGQANYAAANAFLDTFAHWRRAQGLPALAINWGVWAKVGMTAALTQRDQDRWAKQGMGTIAADEGMHLLSELLPATESQLIVLPVNWPVYLNTLAPSNTPPFFEEMAPSTQVEILPQTEQTPIFLQQLATAPQSKKRSIVVNHLQEQVRLLFGLEPSYPIDQRQPLSELGLDSLIAVELRNVLSSNVNSILPATLLFDYPTLGTLADYLIEKVLDLEFPKEEKSKKTDPVEQLERDLAIAELEELSDEDAEALLLAELMDINKKGSENG